MRDHTKLIAFKLADRLVISIYRSTRRFPSHERYGLAAQLRRAAVSIAANIVEGSARTTEGEYLHFLTIALGSARELEYELSLSRRLGYIADNELEVVASSTSRALWALISHFRRQH